MNNTTHRNMILACMALAVLGMLAVSIVQRINNPQLIVQTRGFPQQDMVAEETGGGMPMSPEVGNLMQAVKDNPDDVPTLINLTMHLMETQEWQAAETFVHRAIEFAPENAQAHYLHGIILYNSQRHDEAVKAFEQVVAIAEDASARYSLGILQVYHFENIAKGIEEFERGLRDPNASEELKKAITAELEKIKKTNP